MERTMTNIVEVTEKNFESVKTESEFLIIDFWAGWCGPCKIMKPTLEKFATNNPDIEVIFCNVDEESELAKDYGIKSIPTLLYFEHGEIKGKKIGNVPETQIKEFVNGI